MSAFFQRSRYYLAPGVFLAICLSFLVLGVAAAELDEDEDDEDKVELPKDVQVLLERIAVNQKAIETARDEYYRTFSRSSKSTYQRQVKERARNITKLKTAVDRHSRTEQNTLKRLEKQVDKLERKQENNRSDNARKKTRDEIDNVNEKIYALEFELEAMLSPLDDIEEAIEEEEELDDYSMLGKSVPVIEMNDVGGTKIRFADFKRKNKILIVKLWSMVKDTTDRSSIRSLEKVIRKMPGDDITMVLVHVDKAKKDEFNVYVERRNWDYPVIYDKTRKVARAFREKTARATYIIDKKGIIRRRYVGKIVQRTVIEDLTAILAEDKDKVDPKKKVNGKPPEPERIINPFARRPRAKRKLSKKSTLIQRLPDPDK